MNADGSAVTQLGTGSFRPESSPTWSPDGRRIAFAAFHPSYSIGYEIFVMNVDGSAIKRLTYNSFHDDDPAWSPDGQRIAFASWQDGNRDIYVMNADGSAVTRLTQNAGNNTEPAWSPDGRRIAFVSDRDGDYEIYVMAVPP